MRALWPAIGLASGCDWFFQLDHATLPPAPDAEVLPACWNDLRIGNEDGDALADGCDPCPADPIGVQSDTDEDGVGDACDPDGQSPSEIVEFDGFSEPLAWVPQPASTWSFVNGAYEITNPAGATTELPIRLATRPLVDVLFATTGTIAGVYMEVGPSNTEVKCTHEPRSGADVLVLTVGGVAQPPIVLDAQGAGRLRLEITATDQVVCRGERSGMSATVTGASAAPGSTTSRIGLTGQVVSFHSITVFGAR